MDIGLYTLKYPARKLLMGILPFFRKVSPNAVSWSMVPFGVVIALCCYFAPQGNPFFYLLAILFTMVRMFLGTIDGLMAVQFKKESPSGEVINRLTPELCDLFYLGALTLAKPEWFFLGVIALGVSWLTTFSGLIGMVIQRPIQSVGPVGQTDRLAAFILLLLFQAIGAYRGWHFDFIVLFLAWCIVGGLVTVILRLRRTLLS